MSVSQSEDSSSTTEERAHKLWGAAAQYAIDRKIPVTDTDKGRGYVIKGEATIYEIARTVWPNLLFTHNKPSSAARSFVATLTAYLRKDNNLTKYGSTGWFVKSFYTQRAQRAVQHPILGTVEKPPEITILDRSKKVWDAARRYCEHEYRPTRIIQVEVSGSQVGATYWECDKPLSYFITMCWPNITEYVGGRQPIYDFLRSTTNAVNIGGKHDDEMVGEPVTHSWLIRNDWHEMGGKTLFRTMTREPTDRDRREARLSTTEAGEDREPMPVIISKATQEAVNDMTEPEPDPTPPAAAPESKPAAETDEPYPCTYPGCGRTFKTPHNLGRHVTTQHKNDPDGSQIRKTALDVVQDTFIALERAQVEIADLRAQLAQASKDDGNAARVEAVREVLKQAQSGALAPFGALGAIEQALG
jgi:hypothetical protein